MYENLKIFLGGWRIQSLNENCNKIICLTNRENNFTEGDGEKTRNKSFWKWVGSARLKVKQL